MNGLDVPEKLRDALADARRITNFEGKRRQMQFVGKLMRQLEPDTLAAIRAALQEQHQGSAQLTLALHRAEQWRDRLIAEDDAFGEWVQRFAGTDAQQLRALIRQARKDAPAPDKAAVSHGLAPRQGAPTARSSSWCVSSSPAPTEAGEAFAHDDESPAEPG
jgi:ribosome-associated protein